MERRISFSLILPSLFAAFCFNGRGETEGATGRGGDERFLIDRGFTASATFFMKIRNDVRA